MTVTVDEDVVKTARNREHECHVEVQAFKKRLGLLFWANWLTVVAPALLSIIAGTTVLADLMLAVDDETEIYWKLWTGLAALASALLVAVHKALNCDRYQVECSRLVCAYNGLSAKYRTLHEVGSRDPLERLSELEASLATIRETAYADVPERYRAAARQRIAALPAT